jgi:apolipoprotein N-acyltransferase
VDFLFVATNNAWYGEEGGAYQHAAHAVLRAVETRRPVIRCGNGGWSGWIDEYGNIREVLQRPGKGIYFRGSDIIHVDRDRRWAGRLTFYVRFGDWFVLGCALVSLLAFFTLLFDKKEHYEPGSLLHEERG